MNGTGKPPICLSVCQQTHMQEGLLDKTMKLVVISPFGDALEVHILVQ